jgi:hypothetical protein
VLEALAARASEEDGAAGVSDSIDAAW